MSMFNPEQFRLNIRAIVDNVPDHFGTTMNGCMQWIISEAFIKHFQPRLEALEAKIEELENGNEERSFQKLERNEESLAKVNIPRRRKE